MTGERRKGADPSGPDAGGLRQTKVSAASSRSFFDCSVDARREGRPRRGVRETWRSRGGTWSASWKVQMVGAALGCSTMIKFESRPPSPHGLCRLADAGRFEANQGVKIGPPIEDHSLRLKTCTSRIKLNPGEPYTDSFGHERCTLESMMLNPDCMVQTSCSRWLFRTTFLLLCELGNTGGA